VEVDGRKEREWDGAKQRNWTEGKGRVWRRENNRLDPSVTLYSIYNVPKRNWRSAHSASLRHSQLRYDGMLLIRQN